MCCLVSISFSQELAVTPYGVSPREASADTEDLFDGAYNGLSNVGIGTEVYIMGHLGGLALDGAANWSLDGPTGFTATLSAAVEADTSTQFVAFTPDLVGAYTVTFVSDTFSTDLVIHAGTFLGYEGGTVSCAQCHSGKVTEWLETGHSDMLVRAFNGTLSSHYGSYCVGCHVVGQDGAANDGFDDFDFVYPDSATLVDDYSSTDGHFYDGLYDELATDYPEAFARANIQCENCHGPGSEHLGAAGVMANTLDSKNCAWCHDSGTHHFFPDQWDGAGHASVPGYPGGGRTTCQGCHNGYQFIQFANGEDITPQPSADITCAVCHDPHDVTNEHQVRLVTATLSNGEEVMGAGTGALCMNCHQSRREANSYSDAPHGHYGPHYVPQADMLVGTNVVDFGVNLPSSPHLADTENACADCHMAEVHIGDDGAIPGWGAHSFSMTWDEADHVEACESCHGDIGESFADKKYYLNGDADLDGDGDALGLQDEVHGLMDQLAALLPAADGHDAYDPHDDVDDTWTLVELKAAYNYEMVYYDHSYGIHNPAFTVALLKVSIQAMLNGAIEGDIVAIEDVPNDQGYAVRLVWDRFFNDGVSPDPVETYIVKRYDDFGTNPGFTTVGEVTAEGAPRYAMVVPTLFNLVGTDTAWTEFIVVALHESGDINASMPGEGFSIDNLIPGAPGNVMASAIDNYSVDLEWDASPAPDVNYYILYRDGVEIATTADLNYTDTSLDLGSYTYTIAAVDFNGNEGDVSPGVTAEVLSVVDGTMPIEYNLAQNYPNPFNPVTTISFSLPEAGLVNITVINSVGQVVHELVNRNMDVGVHSINFSAENLPTGVYFYTISANSFTQTKKMILLK